MVGTRPLLSCTTAAVLWWQESTFALLVDLETVLQHSVPQVHLKVSKSGSYILATSRPVGLQQDRL